MKYWICLTFLALMVLTGCDDPTKVYEENKDIPDQVWNKDHRVGFSFNIEDTTQYYTILVNLRHTTFYPNSNLWVMAYTTYPDGTEQEQRLELTLADEQGQWYGSCTGDICNLQQFIQQKAYFQQPGTYKIAFEQIMRTDDLKDVLAIGLRVEKTGERAPIIPTTPTSATDTGSVALPDTSKSLTPVEAADSVQ